MAVCSAQSLSALPPAKTRSRSSLHVVSSRLPECEKRAAVTERPCSSVASGFAFLPPAPPNARTSHRQTVRSSEAVARRCGLASLKSAEKTFFSCTRCVRAPVPPPPGAARGSSSVTRPSVRQTASAPPSPAVRERACSIASSPSGSSGAQYSLTKAELPPPPRSSARTVPSCEQESSRCGRCAAKRIPATGRECGSKVTTGVSSPARTSHSPTLPHVSPAATSILVGDGCIASEKIRSGTSFAMSSSATASELRSILVLRNAGAGASRMLASPSRAKNVAASSADVAPVETFAASSGTLGLRGLRTTGSGVATTGLSGIALPSVSRFC
mmetsp:Transcript_25976/g.87673  ORF Transcript_25976/g.87673 Transcript_25976/m.87673 type:complete len:329 (-) Transcript_25976:220-1206(-)